MSELAIYHDIVQVALGALAAVDMIAGATKQDGSRDQGFRFTRIEWKASVSHLVAAEGPLLIGLGGPDLVVSEIEEALESDPQGGNDSPQMEQSMRPFWPLALFIADSAGGGHSVQQGVLKMGWSFPEHSNMDFWIYNMGSGALTSGAIADLYMKCFGVWLKD